MVLSLLWLILSLLLVHAHRSVEAALHDCATHMIVLAGQPAGTAGHDSMGRYARVLKRTASGVVLYAEETPKA